MNEDDFISNIPYTIIGHGSDVSKTVIADSSGTTLGDLDALVELRDKLAGKVYDITGVDTGIGDLDVGASRGAMDSTFHIPHERKVLIQSQQRVSRLELLHISEDRREEFIDHVKEKALQGLIEQADLINAVSYDEGIDPITHEKIIMAKLKVIIDE